MNILITGGAGGIGSTLGQYLYNKGHEIILVDNLSTGYEENLYDVNGEEFGSFYKEDIRNTKRLTEIMTQEKIECCVHLAAITELATCQEDPQECISVNVGGTASVLEACRLAGVGNVVFSSTSAVYENNIPMEYHSPHILNSSRESDVIHPTLCYSVSKKMAEEICNSYRINYDMNITILRYFNVFGPRQDINRRSPPLINYLVREYINNRTPVLYSHGNQQRDYVHIDDVCKFTELCIRSNTNDCYNVCSGRTISVREIVKAVQVGLGIAAEPTYEDASKRWDVYSILFQGKFPLDKEIVTKETNKFSLGSNLRAMNDFDYIFDKNTEKLIQQVAKQIKVNYE